MSDVKISTELEKYKRILLAAALDKYPRHKQEIAEEVKAFESGDIDYFDPCARDKDNDFIKIMKDEDVMPLQNVMTAKQMAVSMESDAKKWSDIENEIGHIIKLIKG